jgi:DNA polymerase III alpha subunit
VREEEWFGSGKKRQRREHEKQKKQREAQQETVKFHVPKGKVSADGTRYEFSCGCSFEIDASRPLVHGYPSIRYRVEDVPHDCEATWDLISAGRTKGVFQLESSLGKAWARRLRPRNLEHLSALVALLRPGCLKAKDERGVSMTELYCRRKNGEEEVVIDIKAIEHILAPTYDVLCYQEQMMQIAQIVAAFTPVEVDKLRKAAGKKDQKLMTEVGVIFVDKAEKLGVITREEAERLFANIQKSGRYSFNKSHSVCYAIDSYWTAHQKAHIPVYFFTSYLRYAKEKQDPLKEIRALINDAKTFNIEVQPPRFHDFDPHFSTDRVVITFGLSDVKGIGVKNVAKTIAAIGGVEQEVGRPSIQWTWFEFLVYFSEHSNAAMIKKMIEVGALRNFRMDRLRLLAEYDAWTRLTVTERERIAVLNRPLYKMEAVKETVEVEVDDYDKAEMKAYRARCKECKKNGEEKPEHPPAIGKKMAKKKVSARDEDGNVIYREVLDDDEEPIVIDEAREANTLIEAITQLLERPGAVGKDRREKVEAIRDLLLHPASPLEDKPYWIAKKEEEALGLPITCTHVDAADKSMVDTTCKELREGKDLYEMTIGVEINEVREIAVKNGKNRGRKMAYLCVSDETGALDDVTVFSEAWAEYGHLLAREKTVAALQGRKDQQRGSFIVDKVWEI